MTKYPLIRHWGLNFFGSPRASTSARNDTFAGSTRRHNENFFRFDYQVDVEALNDWATVTHFMKGSIGLVVQAPEVTDDFRQFLIIMYGSNWEKRVLGYQTMIIEQLYALITGYGKLTSRMNWVCLNPFDSCSRNQFEAQLKRLAESSSFLEIE